jgi:chromosomal replication initiator protein
VPVEWLPEIAPQAGPSTPREEVVRRAKHVVAEHFGLPVRSLDRATKHPSSLFPRQVAMYLVWRSAALPLDSVARAFGLKSHSAASRAIQEVRSRRDVDPAVETLLDGLLARL